MVNIFLQYFINLKSQISSTNWQNPPVLSINKSIIFEIMKLWNYAAFTPMTARIGSLKSRQFFTHVNQQLNRARSTFFRLSCSCQPCWHLIRSEDDDDEDDGGDDDDEDDGGDDNDDNVDDDDEGGGDDDDDGVIFNDNDGDEGPDDDDDDRYDYGDHNYDDRDDEEYYCNDGESVF